MRSRAEQPSNMEAVLDTLVMSKLLRSRILSPLHPLNILYIDIVLEVSKWERLRVVSLEQP